MASDDGIYEDPTELLDQIRSLQQSDPSARDSVIAPVGLFAASVHNTVNWFSTRVPLDR